jgi:hypothetical protein
MTDGNTIFQQFLANESLWLDSMAVGLRIDANSSDPKAVAGQARRDEKIFAAWDGERYHYPAFQFEPDGGPRSQTAKLIKVLPRESDGRLGLDAVFWVFWPDYAFDGKTPAEAFTLEPERVIEEARIRFLEGGRD